MKKYLILALCGVVVGGTLALFFSRSHSSLNENHSRTLKMLFYIKNSDAVLNANVMRSKAFLSQNFDAIVEKEEAIETFCAQPDAAFSSEASSPDLIKNYNEYCEAMNAKLHNVETFKSRQAVYRNSIIYLHTAAVELNESAGSSQVEDLVSAAVIYALISEPSSRHQLQEQMKQSERNLRRHSPSQLNYNVAEILAHCRRILETKPEIDSITEEILSSESANLWTKMRETYLENYDRAERSAGRYRLLLFASCSFLFVFVISSILRTWQAARALEDMNQNLEDRVRARTTELLASQKTIVDQQQALMASAKLSALGEMAGGVAHEINTPLATIQLRTEQLLEYVAENDMAKENFADSLHGIEQTVRRIANIVQGLRSFARDGRRDPMIAYPIKRIVDDTFALCRERFFNHGVDLNFEVQINTPDLLINCRPTEISQVLLNLLNNSFDAIKDLPEKWIEVSVRLEESKALLEVTDSGAGIPPEIQEKLMQPFFTTKEVGKGTGLGLSISKGIIDTHGGQLSINNTSKNTCFTVALPRAS